MLMIIHFSVFSKKSTYAKMISIDPSSLLIIGSFKKQTSDPDFKVKLLMIDIFFLIISKEQPIQCENPFKYDELNQKNQFVRFTILNTWISSSTTWQSYFSFDLTCSFVRFFALRRFAWNHKDRFSANKLSELFCALFNSVSHTHAIWLENEMLRKSLFYKKNLINIFYLQRENRIVFPFILQFFFHFPFLSLLYLPLDNPWKMGTKHSYI